MRHTLTRTVLLATGSTSMLTSCGNYLNIELSGRTGVSHDGNGNLSLHVNTCENSTRHVEVVAGREGLASEEVNPTIGSFVRDEPVSGSFVVRVQDPSPWSVDQELVLPDDRSHFFIVSARPDDDGGPAFIRPEKYFSGAAVTYDDLMTVSSGIIVTGTYDGQLSTVTQELFDATCDNR